MIEEQKDTIPIDIPLTENLNIEIIINREDSVFIKNIINELLFGQDIREDISKLKSIVKQIKKSSKQDPYLLEEKIEIEKDLRKKIERNIQIKKLQIDRIYRYDPTNINDIIEKYPDNSFPFWIQGYFQTENHKLQKFNRQCSCLNDISEPQHLGFGGSTNTYSILYKDTQAVLKFTPLQDEEVVSTYELTTTIAFLLEKEGIYPKIYRNCICRINDIPVGISIEEKMDINFSQIVKNLSNNFNKYFLENNSPNEQNEKFIQILEELFNISIVFNCFNKIALSHNIFLSDIFDNLNNIMLKGNKIYIIDVGSCTFITKYIKKWTHVEIYKQLCGFFHKNLNNYPPIFSSVYFFQDIFEEFMRKRQEVS